MPSLYTLDVPLEDMDALCIIPPMYVYACITLSFGITCLLFSVQNMEYGTHLGFVTLLTLFLEYCDYIYPFFL